MITEAPENRGDMLNNVEAAISDSIGHTEDSSGNKLESPTAPAIDTGRLGGTTTEQADAISKGKGYGDGGSKRSAEADEFLAGMGVGSWQERVYASKAKKYFDEHTAKLTARLKADHEVEMGKLTSKSAEADAVERLLLSDDDSVVDAVMRNLAEQNPRFARFLGAQQAQQPQSDVERLRREI